MPSKLKSLKLKSITFIASLSSCKQRIVMNYKRKRGTTMNSFYSFSRGFLNLQSSSSYRLCPSPRPSAEST